MFNVIKLKYIFAAILIALSSCSQGGDPVPPTDNNTIKFSTAYGQRSRSYEVNEETLKKFNVTCFYSCMGSNPDGTLKPYFAEATFVKTDGFFTSPYMSAIWPPEDESLKFLAYYPDTLSFSNQTKSIDNIVYKIEEFKVDTLIANHIDFVTAYKDTTKCNTVKLVFMHQLSRIELQAKSENTKYNFDIAGIRLGSQVYTATFDFLTNASNPGKWDIKVTKKDGVSHTYLDPQKIVTLNDENIAKQPFSIMGDGGAAMVVPIKESAWNPEKEWGTDGGKMYFSILLRATSKDGTVFYPYQKGEHNGLKVCEIVDSNGNTLTDANGQPMVFGWAAVPVEINWVAGKKYVYTLNFTDGIGLHDPEDPEPGHTIEEGNSGYGVSLSVDSWEKPTQGSYNPDISVPYE